VRPSYVTCVVTATALIAEIVTGEHRIIGCRFMLCESRS